MRSIVRSRRVHRAFSVSLAIHLLILAIWLTGQTFHVWDLIPTPPFAKNIRERLLPPAHESRQDMAKKKVEPPPAEEMTLTFVEVDTSKQVKEAPADAKFIAAVNTEAGNPEVGNKDVPKIDGKQTDFLKITENKLSIPALPPPSVAKNESPAQQSQNAEPPPTPKEQPKTDDIKEVTQKQPPAKPADQAPQEIKEPAKAEPETVAQASKEPKQVAEPKPLAQATQTPPPNTSKAPDPSEISQRESEQAKKITPPKTEAKEKALTQVPEIDSPVSETAGASAGANVSPVESTPETLPLEPEKVTQLASIKPLEPRQSSPAIQKTDETVIEEILKSAEALQREKLGQTQPVTFAKTKPAQNPNQNSESQNNSLANPDSRPRRLDEVKRSTPGEKLSMDGGVQRFDLNAALTAKGTVIGDYTQRMVDAIRQRWYIGLDAVTTTKPGKVVMDFRIHNDGRVSHVTIRESSVGELQSIICQTAITDPAPFARWPDAMRNEWKTDWQEVTFTFYYLAN